MKLCLFSILCVAALSGCGSSEAPTFAGEWDGSFVSLQNECPFSVKQDINPLFPQLVSIDESAVFTVSAVDGSLATGGQGPGETISFLATADTFGDFGSIAPYTCESTSAEIGYLGIGDDQAKVTLTTFFNNCSQPGSTDPVISCATIYFGDAQRVG